MGKKGYQMAKKRSGKSSSSSKRGYGIHNVDQRKNLKSLVNKISKKNYNAITSMDIYRLYEFGWSTEKIAKNYNTSKFKIINQLRLT